MPSQVVLPPNLDLKFPVKATSSKQRSKLCSEYLHGVKTWADQLDAVGKHVDDVALLSKSGLYSKFLIRN